MNVAQASEQIEGAIRAYLSRDERGLARIPERMQRPIILMGPPGIGKTAIVSQVAERLGINFVAYSMTHHTRQSALGLPYIAEATYGGKPYRVSRYTMSEIIAATYDAIETSGVAEGILFLDEVNCVSETLAPALLQFLQFKSFGQHKLPAGWVVVCAGNPPEYNRSAREFDPATLDRMKRMDVQPDLDVWMDYAVSHRVHPAVTTYLANKPENFYRVRTTVTGPRMVTARGWEDLSRILSAYEAEGLEVGTELVSQYLQDRDIAEDFSLYWDLFAKYQEDYKVDAILSGEAGDDIVAHAGQAPLDERVALVNLLLDALGREVHAAVNTEDGLRAVRDDLAGMYSGLMSNPEKALSVMDTLVATAKSNLDATHGSTTSEDRLLSLTVRASTLASAREAVGRWALGADGSTDGFEAARSAFNERTAALRHDVATTAEHIDAAMNFVDRTFGNGQELLILVSRLSVDPTFMRFVSTHGPASFVEHTEGLTFHERGLELLREARALEGL